MARTIGSKNKEKEKVFATSDLGLASALSAIGHQIVKTEKPDREVLFIFMDAEDLIEDAQRYFNGDLMVDAFKLCFEQKSLRRMIGAYMRREDEKKGLKEHFISKRHTD